MSPTKSCQQCGESIQGRLDKKFCDDHCRSNFNNLFNSDISSTMRSINYILRKNRRILAAILPKSGKAKINKDKLNEIGFDFRHFTHCQKTQKGRTYKICYDYGYLIVKDKEVLLIRCKDKNCNFGRTSRQAPKKQEKRNSEQTYQGGKQAT